MRVILLVLAAKTVGAGDAAHEECYDEQNCAKHAPSNVRRREDDDLE
jgi:hypothetical protein